MTVKGVMRASKGRYHIVVGDIHYDLTSRSITFTDLKLEPDTNIIGQARRSGDSIGKIFYVTVPELRINTVHLFKAWRKQAIQADEIEVNGADVRVVRNKKWLPHNSQDSSAGFDLSKIVPKPYKVIRFARLQVNDASIEMRDENTSANNTPLQVSHVYTTITDLEIDKKPEAQHKRLYYAHSLAIQIRNFEKALPDSVHRLHVDTIRFENNNVVFNNAQVYTDKALLKKAVRTLGLDHISIPQVQIDSIDIFKALNQDDIFIKSIRISKPVIVLNHPAHQDKGARFEFNPLSYLPKSYRSFTLGQLIVSGGSVSFFPSNNPQSGRLSLSPLEAKVTNFHIDTIGFGSDKRLLYSDNVQLWIPPFRRVINNGLSRLDIGSIYMSSAARKIVFSSIALRQLLGKVQLGRRLGHATDWVNLYAGNIQLSNINVHDLLINQQFIAGNCSVSYLNFYDFRDKRLQDPPFRRKPLPSEMIRSFDYLVDIATVNVNRAQIAYEEFGEKGKNTGIIHCTNASAVVHNLNNSGAPGIMTAVLKGQMEGQGSALLQMTIPLERGSMSYHVSGNISDVPFTAFNPMSDPTMGVQLTSGIIRQMQFDFTALEDSAYGVMHFAYNGLQIQVTNQRSDDQHGLKQVLGTFIVNNLILQSDNPKPEQSLRVARISYVRDKNKSFVNYTWNSIMSGILNSVGIANLKSKMQKKQEQKTIKQEIKDELKLRHQLKKIQRQQRRQNRKNQKADSASAPNQ